MKKLVILFAALIAATNAISFFEVVKEEWHAFKMEHSKSYESEIEEELRMKIFMTNKHKIAQHNQLYEKGQVSFKLGLNKYADLLNQEFVQTMNGFNLSNSLRSDHNEVKRFDEPVFFIEPINVELPKSMDWREKGAVTEVKDQGHCGSCWTFSATGALEGQNFRKTDTLVSLSEQNLIDCASAYQNNGCQGGLMDHAFQYIKENGGIDTEKSYPYEGIDDTCKFKASDVGAKDRGFVDIPEGNEKKLTAALATIGPISVAIDASHESFQFYSSGIYYEPKCDSQQLDHGVLAVGYGTDENGQDYYIVKNSWGTTWGDKGYVKMARNRKNHCGIATSASYPLV